MSSDLEELRRELDIVDVVSRFVPLERVGSNYRANCPFHPDRTPSFFVSPSKGIFKCFGCGVGGDAIKFYALYENLSYLEAARELARLYGKRFNLAGVKEEEKVRVALERVSDFYRESLLKNEEALEYLKARGVDGHTVKRFSVGYAPDSRKLAEFLKREGLLEEYLKTRNLVSLGSGNYRDLFLKRVVLPVRTPSGRTAGFSGRRLREDGSPKYVNSPESPYFKKSSLLFGLSETKDYAKEEGYALLVEGVFDVLKLFSAGVRNAAAPLGTALTEQQARVLAAYVKKVYLLFDGDEAGRKAVRRAVPLLLSAGLEVFVVRLPEGHDPDSFVTEYGVKALKGLISSAEELFSSLINGGRDSLEERIKLFREYLSYLPDDAKRIALAAEFQQKAKVPLETLLTPPKRRQASSSLPFKYKVLLKGLLSFRPKVRPEELELPKEVRELCYKALDGEEHELPEEVLEFNSPNLERMFYKVLEQLKKREFVREVEQ